MEPVDEKNIDHSHVAHRMKHKPVKFEDDTGIYYIKITFSVYVVFSGALYFAIH